MSKQTLGMPLAYSLATKTRTADTEERSDRTVAPVHFKPVNYGIRIWIVYGHDETNTEISARATEFLECWEINAHAHAVCTRPSPPRAEGLGTRLGLDHGQVESEGLVKHPGIRIINRTSGYSIGGRLFMINRRPVE